MAFRAGVCIMAAVAAPSLRLVFLNVTSHHSGPDQVEAAAAFNRGRMVRA